MKDAIYTFCPVHFGDCGYVQVPMSPWDPEARAMLHLRISFGWISDLQGVRELVCRYLPDELPRVWGMAHTLGERLLPQSRPAYCRQPWTRPKIADNPSGLVPTAMKGTASVNFVYILYFIDAYSASKEQMQDGSSLSAWAEEMLAGRPPWGPDPGCAASWQQTASPQQKPAIQKQSSSNSLARHPLRRRLDKKSS